MTEDLSSSHELRPADRLDRADRADRSERADRSDRLDRPERPERAERAVPAARRPDGEPLARGATIGRFVVLGLVGRGGMGDVYAAYDPELDRKIAVKLMRPTRDRRVDASEGRSRLLREAQAIARLSHPNVVVVYDVGTFNESVFIAMEFVEGQTVGYWRQAANRSWREVLTVFQAAGRGLEAAHQAGMVHRDFKPDNVMVTADGQVRVMDFGLARQMMEVDHREATASSRLAARMAAAAAAGYDPESTVPLRPSDIAPQLAAAAAALYADDDLSQSLSTSSSSHLDAKLTQTGTVLGTPAYMAPEQFAGKATDARTDQFSFCVALYESLYGNRPFEGRTVPALMASVLSGEITPAPTDSKVPAWVRRILLRGLRRDPGARYPNMGALLAALGHDPAQALRRRLTLAGAVLSGVGVMAGVGVGWRATHAGAGLCASGTERLAGVWEGTGVRASARKAAIRQAFAATGKSYAGTAFASVQQILDRYVGAWTAMYADACQATHVRGEQSSEVLDLRMSCLSERLGRVKALTDVFAQANATVVENAVVAASALPSLDRCADVKLLRAVVPPPDDPKARAKVEALKREVARVRAIGDSGQCAAAAEAGKKLIKEAEGVGYLPLQAESMNALGRSGAECMSLDDEVEMHKGAILAATSSHHDEASVQAMIFLAHIEADRTARVAESRNWIDLANATLRGMSGSHPMLEGDRLQSLGRVFAKEGKLEQALQTLQQAQALIEKTKGSEHPDVGVVLNNIGLVLQEMHRLDEALVYFKRAETFTAKIEGTDHPAILYPLGNQAEVLNALHRYDEARGALERAIAIGRKANSSTFITAWMLTTLGEALLGQRHARDAVARLDEALRLLGSAATPYVGQTRFLLAQALWPSGDRARAIELARSARSHYQALNDAKRMLEVDSWLRARGAQL